LGSVEPPKDIAVAHAQVSSCIEQVVADMAAMLTYVNGMYQDSDYDYWMSSSALELSGANPDPCALLEQATDQMSRYVSDIN
jgi:hypothetical protein